MPLPMPERNLNTYFGVIMGKMLFNDKGLSGNGKISCSGCHRPEYWFSDTVALSVGINTTKRNTPSLSNVAWAPRLFADGGGADLESQALASLHHPGEMGGNYVGIESYVNEQLIYKVLSALAFGTCDIGIKHVSFALSQYERTLVSLTSRYDSVYRMNLDSPTREESLGNKVFATHCAECHAPPFFTDFDYHRVQAKSSVYLRQDLGIATGRYRITLDTADIGAYRTPSLRNWRYTYPYMHDGSVRTIQECMHHYPSNTDTLSKQEQKSLMVFLDMLNESPAKLK